MRDDSQPRLPDAGTLQQGAQGQEASSAQGASDPFRVVPPVVSLPKGGGALRGIGEKFTANPVTGTGTMLVPIALSPGRGGFGPQLAVSYDSGSGQGVFGMGWTLALPGITRKTDKGLPRYLDADESDVFLLSGADDLVPMLDSSGRRAEGEPARLAGESYKVHCYRPRVEGLFARIERWVIEGRMATAFWRTITRDNVTTWFGRTPDSRVSDAASDGEERVYQWLASQTHDDKGNVALYEYIGEDDRNVDMTTVCEANRDPAARRRHRYLKRIKYGNVEPYMPQLGPELPDPVPEEWLFEAVFDYGDHEGHPHNDRFPTPQPDRAWGARGDAFSSHRAGFEIRTYRLCRRILMFHHFPEADAVGAACLVRSTEFDYGGQELVEDPEAPGYTTLRSVVHRSYRRRPGGAPGYSWQDLPPVRFEYSRPVVDPTVRNIAAEELSNLPVGTRGPGYRWVDLDGEGLSGVLAQGTGSWYYKPNLGDGQFGPMREVARAPASAVASGTHTQFIDLAGDGELDVVEFGGFTPGFHERDQELGWKRHVPFASLPNIDWQDPYLRFIDLTGDGHADALVTEQDVFTWFPSLSERGFGAARRTRLGFNEDAGPCLVFADDVQSIFLADMCGDGLTDLVRIRNGEVCYWPNQGYGRFGRKVTLANSPRFDHADLFDPARVRLADIDGSGPIDIIYLGRDGAKLYFNRSGNSFSNALVVALPLATENLAAVQVADLLGNGTACLVWNSHLPGDASQPARYIDLMGGAAEAPQQHRRHQKPHLLVRIDNSLGATTDLEYTPSTRFYLQDLRAGQPWVTRLPFPVHCLSRVTARDKWRGTSFSSTYSYHHGFFDGVEREFRGFGRVEQVDVEDFGAFADANANSPWITKDKNLYQPPVKTVTWYHTGAALERQPVLAHFEHEYFPQRFASRLPQGAGAFHERQLPDPELPTDLSTDEWREALRACKGMVLRQEVYELDLDDLVAETPRQTPVRLFSAAVHNCRVQRLQARGDNAQSVFLVTESEALSYQYELPLPNDQSLLKPDPRVSHTLNLRNDEQGHSVQSVAVGYGRLHPAHYPGPQRPDLITQVQAEVHIAYTESHYTADVILPATPDGDSPIRHHRLRLPFQTLTYELRGIPRVAPYYFSPSDLLACDLSDVYGHGVGESPPPTAVQFKRYHEFADASMPQKRIVQHARSRYFDDASDTSPPGNNAPLPFGTHGPRGLKFEDYRLAITAELLEAVFRQDHAGGVVDDKLAWVVQPAGVDHAPRTALDLLRDEGVSGYWSEEQPSDATPPAEYWIRSGTAGFTEDAHRHYFLPERFTDPFGNATTLCFDRLDLFVASSTDAMGNVTQVGGFNPQDPPRVLSGFDYRVLTPSTVVDINGNEAQMAFDVLGLPAATALRGKQGEGDNLSYSHDTGEAGLNARIAFFTQDFSLPAARTLLGQAGTRYVHYFGETRAPDGSVRYGMHPPCAAMIQREVHASDLERGQDSPLQIAFEYADGSGALLMRKVRAEAVASSSDDPRPAQRVLDDFTSGDFAREYVVAGAGDTLDTQAQPGAMAGGERFWGLLLRGVPGGGASINIPGSDGGFAFHTEPGIVHRFDWSYGTTYIRYTPLELDLSLFNALRFNFLEVPRGLNFNVLLYFRGQADNYAQLGVNIGPQSGPFDLDLAFDSFRARIADPSRPADFTQLSGIYIVTQSGGWTSGGGEGFTLRSVSAVALPRWVVNGRTVLNNKGKPVKQFEPYFTDSHWYEETAERGVSPVIFYDAAGRVVRTEFPDGTHSRSVFSPWHTAMWDQNDTVLASTWYALRNQHDPSEPYPVTLPGLARSAPRGFVSPSKREHLENQFDVTAPADSELRAAWLAVRHANTPALAILDTLGRAVVAVAHDRVEDPTGPHRFDGRQWKDLYYLTFTKLDTEGKPLWIRDARDNLAVQYVIPPKPTRLADDNDEELPQHTTNGIDTYSAPCYDMAGNLLYQSSMNAGDRWVLMDAAGKPMLSWDANHWQIDDETFADAHLLYLTEYDRLRRPTCQWLSVWLPRVDTDAILELASREQIERFEYQDAAAEDKTNLNGQIIRRFDSSGLVRTVRRDFKGNVQEVQRTLVLDPVASRTDWSTDFRDSKLEAESYTQITVHDALGRAKRIFNWHRADQPVAVYEQAYNERGLVRSESIRIRAVKTVDGYQRGTGELSQAIEDIRYSARGQVESLRLGNGTATQYQHDPLTTRLRQIFTSRPPDRRFPGYRSQLRDAHVLQQLLYTYDPVGNVTELEDQAFKPVYFAGDFAEPRSRYEYDALYRLTRARGRETAQGGEAAASGAEPAYGKGFPITDQTLRTFEQSYRYDPVGNLVSMQHAAFGRTADGWTRSYTTEDRSNRLKSTEQGSGGPIEYRYDTHGNKLNLALVGTRYLLRWDHLDMLRSIHLGGGGEVWYQYDGSKRRTRKYIRRSDGTSEERVYLGGLERYRRWTGNKVVEEIESLHLFSGGQRVLLVDDVQRADDAAQPGPNGLSVEPHTLFRYQYSNHLGSALAELDGEGIPVSYEEFHPYGTSAYRLMRAKSKAPAKRYRFSGLERDEESGLGYHHARFYAAALARWCSADPIRPLDGYAYASGAPTVMTDANGLTPDAIVQTVKQALPYAGATATNGLWLYWWAAAAKVPVVTTAAATASTEIVAGTATTAAATSIEVVAAGSATAVSGAGTATTAAAATGTIGAAAVGAAVLAGAAFLSMVYGIVSLTISGAKSKQAELEAEGQRLEAERLSRIAPPEDYREAPAAKPALPAQLPGNRSGGESGTILDPSPASGRSKKAPGQNERQHQQPLGDPASSPERRAELGSRAHNKTFMEQMLKKILGDPQHPLRFLVSEETGNWKSRQKYSLYPTVQAGHTKSLFGLGDGEAEGLAIEDSAFNQLTSNVAESKGVIAIKFAVDIGGVSVEWRTASLYARLGLLTGIQLDGLLATPGWRPKPPGAK